MSKPFYKKKKVVVTFVAVLIVLAKKYVNMSEEDLQTVTNSMMVLVAAIGAEDFGKAAK